MVGACSLTIAATVVPHEPAPITATDVWDPTLGSIRGPMFPDAVPRPRVRRGDPDPRVRAGQGPTRRFARRRRARRTRSPVGRAGGARRRRPAGGRGVVGPDVRAWASDLALDVLDDPGTLDGAADAGRDHLRSPTGAPGRRRARRSPAARTTSPGSHATASQPIVALVPCHRDDGTPVLSSRRRRLPVRLRTRLVPPPRGRGRRLGLGLRVVRDADLALRRRRPRRPGGAATRATAESRRAVTLRPTPRLRAARPRHRRPSRRHRVRVRRHAREVGARGLRTSSCWCSPTVEGHLGTRRRTSPRSSATRQDEQRAAARALGAREVHFLDAVDGELEDDAARRSRCAR